MINPVSSNMNFIGKATIGQDLADSRKQAERINKFGERASRQNEKILTDGLIELKEELASSTGFDEDVSICFEYGINNWNNKGFSKGDELIIKMHDNDDASETIIAKSYIAGAPDLDKKDMPKANYGEIADALNDLFESARLGAFRYFGLNDKKAEENKHINEIFDMLA